VGGDGLFPVEWAKPFSNRNTKVSAAFSNRNREEPVGRRNLMAEILLKTFAQGPVPLLSTDFKRAGSQIGAVNEDSL